MCLLRCTFFHFLVIFGNCLRFTLIWKAYKRLFEGIVHPKQYLVVPTDFQSKEKIYTIEVNNEEKLFGSQILFKYIFSVQQKEQTHSEQLDGG